MFLRSSLAQYKYIYFCRYISGSCPPPTPPPPPILKSLATLLFFKAFVDTYSLSSCTCTSLKVIPVCTYLYSPCSLTRCGATAAIDPVCERVASESSVLLNVTHGEVYVNTRCSVLSLSLTDRHCNIVIDYGMNIVISS